MTFFKDDTNLYEIRREKITHFYADAILRASVKMRYLEFQLILRKLIPASFNYEYKLEDIQVRDYFVEP